LKLKTDWFTDIDASNLNVRDVLGCTPLHYAAWLRDEENARLPLVRGAKPTSPDLSRQKGGNSGSLDFLEHRADYRTEIAMHLAAQRGYDSDVPLLLENGIDKESKDGDEWTAL